MAKRSKKVQRDSQPKQDTAVRPGYLPTADPPPCRPALLAVSAAILALWLIMLAWMAISA